MLAHLDYANTKIFFFSCNYLDTIGVVAMWPESDISPLVVGHQDKWSYLD